MITNPYEGSAGGQWLRGNLHTHTTRSDGRHDPADVVAMYRDAGYDFLGMSDHDHVFTAGELSALDSGPMLLIGGNEVTARAQHVVHVHADACVEPHWNRQQVINQINQGSGFAIVAHPNFKEFNHCTIDNLLAWRDYAGIEIYNGVVGRSTGSPYAIEHWDRLLSSGRPAWGFANDDLHDAGEGDFSRGWNMVLARNRTREEIVNALRGGRFYASTGVVISRIEVQGPRVRIETENSDRIVAVCDTGRRVAVVDDSVAEVEMPAEMTYMRFECWGRGEQFAWTQPFRVN